MAINRHLLHVKSNQTVTTTVDNEDVTRAKLPSPSNIEHGEIAINYHDGYETISIKNDNNEIVEFPNLNAVNILINEAMSGAQDALTFDETPTENSTNPVTSGGIKEYVDTGDSIQSLTTYDTSTPLAVGDTHDEALSKLSKIIDDNETVVARALTELEDTKADKDDLYTKDEVDNLIEETNDSLTQIIEDNELTIATALNDLDSRISNMKGRIEELNEPSESTPLAVGDTYDDAFAKLTKIIRDDEEITARALTDLNETKQDEITDLDTIRSGAARGATALQSETQLSKGTSTGDGNVVTDIAVNNHQITLTMGLTALTENALKTVNSLSLVGNGNIDAEDVILGKLVEGSGALAVKNFYRFNGTYTQKPTDIVPSPDFSDTSETPNDKKIYVDILTKKIYWYTSNSGIPAGQRFKELCEVDLSSYADGAEYDSTEKKIYLKHGSTRLSNPIDATDFIKDGMVNSVRVDTLDDGSSDDGSDAYDERYLIITFNTDAGMEDIEIPLSDIFDPSLYYTKEEIDEHELVTAAALTELHDTKQDLLSFDSTPTTNSTNPVTSGGIKTSLDSKQDVLTFDSTPTDNSTNPVTSQGIKTYVDTAIGDITLITAAALNDLNDNKQDNLTFDSEPTEDSENPVTSQGIKTYVESAIGDISNEIEKLEEPLVSTPLAVGDTYDEAFAKLTKIIRDNELATAGVLTELHDTKQDLLTFDDEPTANSENPVTSGGVYTALSNINTDHLTEVTYSELKTLRDGNELVPGMFYRITDYQCTTTQTNTKSAGHQFDIILLALSENKLAEEGWAMMHDNIYDVTFSDGVTKKCYWYVIEIYQDSSFYASLVDVSTLSGIYFEDVLLPNADFTINDENKTIVFTNHSDVTSQYFDEQSQEDVPYNYFQNSNLSAWKVWYCLDNDKVKYSWADTTNGKGVIYRMIDEWGNDVPYDFKNIQFKRKLTNGQYDPTSGTDTWVYTFNAILDGTQSDNSLGLNLALAGGSGIITTCAENVIKPYYDYSNQQSVLGGQGEIVLNNNVFLCNAASLQYIQSLFVYANKFDVNSSGNTFKNMTAENIFGSDCMNNTFDDNCSTNVVGNVFSDNTIKRGFSRNVVGNYVHNCQFNWECIDNMFGNYIENCAFGNPLGAVNSSDSGFYHNTIGNNCYYLSLIGDISNFTIGNGVHSFYTTEITTNSVIVENGVSYVTLDCPSSDDYTKLCTNITIAQGVSGTSSAQKIITHPTVNDTIQTIYRPTNSQVVSV